MAESCALSFLLTNRTEALRSPLICDVVSCCHGLVLVTYRPCAPLTSHVEKFWRCDGYQGGHRTERVLLVRGKRPVNADTRVQHRQPRENH